ncbi:membrane protein [Salmonella enterica subsp. arizonae]|uniref:Membrane protein n=1 Tax=Salmonella enterica subsp. arizonae TaxID=59203 RepID=A0A2X4TMA1_SALER|nr:membrane protein [Salmonella enterica subsp. arizonae]
MLFAWITDPNAWLALGTLTLLEIVLGIDNIIFLSLVVAKLPTAQRNHARRLGLAAAMIMRLALLASIAWVTRLTNPLFELFGEAISARDLILLLGGLFLIWKASKEIHESIEGEEEGLKTRVSSFLGAIVQIMLLDIIFSLDSVITAVGLSDHLFIMMAAVVIAVGVMMFAARAHRRVCRSSPVGKNAGALLSDSGWLYPDSGKFRRPRSERVYLFRHVLLYRGREPESVAQ